jgi:hypothetical protein
MKNWFATALGAALMAMAGASSDARASKIDFGVVGLGGDVTYAGGATLDASSSLDLDTALLAVSKVGVGDDSGLSVFPSGTSNTVSISPSDIIYGFGSGPESSPLGTPIFKTWTGAGGDSFNEDLTTVVSINRATASAITVVLEGTITDTGGFFSVAPVFLILTASQAGGPGNVVAASLTNTTTFGGVPEPSTWMMMALGFGALGYLASRRRKSKMSMFSV